MTASILVLVAGLYPPAERVQSPPSLVAITHVSVIDTTSGRVQADQSIVIKDGRIVEPGERPDAALPLDADVVDGTGKFLIPGLWDMHSHIAAANRAGAKEYLDLYLANGITGVREMHAFFPRSDLRPTQRYRDWKTDRPAHCGGRRHDRRSEAQRGRRCRGRGCQSGAHGGAITQETRRGLHQGPQQAAPRGSFWQ